MRVLLVLLPVQIAVRETVDSLKEGTTDHVPDQQEASEKGKDASVEGHSKSAATASARQTDDTPPHMDSPSAGTTKRKGAPDDAVAASKRAKLVESSLVDDDTQLPAVCVSPNVARTAVEAGTTAPVGGTGVHTTHSNSQTNKQASTGSQQIMLAKIKNMKTITTAKFIFRVRRSNAVDVLRTLTSPLPVYYEYQGNTVYGLYPKFWLDACCKAFEEGHMIQGRILLCKDQTYTPCVPQRLLITSDFMELAGCMDTRTSYFGSAVLLGRNLFGIDKGVAVIGVSAYVFDSV